MKSASQKGCIVVLSRSVEGRILIKDLSDTFVIDPVESFPPGKVVRGRYVSMIAAVLSRVRIGLSFVFSV